MFTKGEMIKDLKNWGIRHADKQGVGTVPLEHLKYEDVASKWSEYKDDHPDAISVMDKR